MISRTTMLKTGLVKFILLLSRDRRVLCLILALAFAVTSHTMLPATSTATVAGFAIGEPGGELSPVTGSPWNSKAHNEGATVTPDGRYLFLGGTTYGSPAGAYGFTADGSSGQIFPILGSPFNPDSRTIALDTTPDGKFLFAADHFNHKLVVYSINDSSGALAQVGDSPYDTEQRPRGVAVAPGGDRVYVTNSYSKSISIFNVNQSTGQLDEVPGSPVSTPAATGSWDLVLSPDGKHLYTANWNSSNISAYDVDQSTGLLTEVAGSPYESGGGDHGPQTIDISPDGKHLYVGNFVSFTEGSVSAYNVDGVTGQLTELASSPLTVGMSPEGLAVAPNGSRVAVVVYEDANNIWMFNRNDVSGDLTVTSSTRQTARYGGSIAFSPDSRFLYVGFVGSDFDESPPSWAPSNLCCASSGQSWQQPTVSLKLSGRKNQRLSKRGVKLIAECSRNCTVEFSGKVVFSQRWKKGKSAKGNRKHPKRTQKIWISLTTRNLRRNHPTKVTLKFSHRGYRVLKRVLKKRRRLRLQVKSAVPHVGSSGHQRLKVWLKKPARRASKRAKKRR